MTPKRRLWPWLFVAALAVGCWFTRSTWLSWVSPGSNGGPPAKPQRVIPVRTAVVQKRDLHLYLNGLGTVTAFKTVTIKSRVDGEIINVAFTEGQTVKEGELLAEIDPRPFQAQLDQVEPARLAAGFRDLEDFHGAGH
jgi:multidrug efflux system membrane fusion protein